MWTLELLIRLSVGEGLKAIEFFGPAIAATAVGLILPTCVPKQFSSDRFEALFGFRVPPGFTIRTGLDEQVVPLGLIAVFLGLGGWAVTLFLSVGGKFPGVLQTWIQQANVQAWICGIIYGFAVLLTELKERA